MQKKPLVSICCLAYNHEEYIREAIEGFLMQKTTFPFEIIIHDDASTDRTAKIIQEYASQHPDLFVTIYQTTNKYSQGIKLPPTYLWPNANGKYIAMCEGDDYWTDPNKLQKQIIFLEDNPIYSASSHRCYLKNEITNINSHFGNDIEKSIYLKDLLDFRPFHTASLVFKKEAIIEYTKILIPGIISGDKMTNLLCGIQGPIMYFAIPMATYRRNKGGVSSGNIKDTKRFLNNNLRIFKFFKGKIPFKYYIQLKFAETSKLNLIKNNSSFSDRLIYYFISIIYSLPCFKRNYRTVITMTFNLFKNMKN
ncbi:MAG TPA: glycosyltransferase [Epulopiscium sp.]|nr:glycosyltransferase [Candidatus Epulonipiscium sp.]